VPISPIPSSSFSVRETQRMARVRPSVMAMGFENPYRTMWLCFIYLIDVTENVQRNYSKCISLYHASLRSNSPYLQKPTKASNKLLHTLFYRNVDAWNALPIALRSVSSLHMFKCGLRNVDLSHYLKGSIF
jgi:hypothetical protein